MPDFGYSMGDLHEIYGNIDEHFFVNRIIISHSTLHSDIRRVATTGLNLSKVKKVLDLGCGFGFFSNVLKGLIHKDAVVTGIDILPENAEPFLRSTKKSGLKSDFIADEVDIIKEFPDNSYDLIISCYSLYYFPHIIDEIARILNPEGIFIPITHSKNGLIEILNLLPDIYQEIGIKEKQPFSVQKLISKFCTENALNILNPHFKQVREVQWKNYLIFNYHDITDLITYVDSKKNLFLKELMEIKPDMEDIVIDKLFRNIRRIARQQGYFQVNKVDSIYHCTL